jgi:hypothetical protein
MTPSDASIHGRSYLDRFAVYTVQYYMYIAPCLVSFFLSLTVFPHRALLVLSRVCSLDRLATSPRSQQEAFAVDMTTISPVPDPYTNTQTRSIMEESLKIVLPELLAGELRVSYDLLRSCSLESQRDSSWYRRLDDV